MAEGVAVPDKAANADTADLILDLDQDRGHRSMPENAETTERDPDHAAEKAAEIGGDMMQITDRVEHQMMHAERMVSINRMTSPAAKCVSMLHQQRVRMTATSIQKLSSTQALLLWNTRRKTAVLQLPWRCNVRDVLLVTSTYRS